MNTFKVITTFLILVSFSCTQKEENCYLNLCINWGKYTSESNLNDNIKWKADHCWFGTQNDIQAKNYGKTVIHMNFNNQFGELRENIRVQDFNLSIGKKNLVAAWGIWTADFYEPTAHFDTFASDGDASTEFYDLYNKEGFENYLTIKSISADGSEIEGEYQLYFVISQDSPSKFTKTRPDTLIFTNGVFTAKKLN